MGEPGTGNGQFNVPDGVATDAVGNVYVADVFNRRIQKFDSTGTYLTQWGCLGTGDGQFDDPHRRRHGRRRQRLRRGLRQPPDPEVRLRTGTYLTQWGCVGSGDGQFNDPFGVATDCRRQRLRRRLGNHRIQKFRQETQTGSTLAPPA